MSEIYPQGSQDFNPFDELSDADANDVPYPTEGDEIAWLFNPLNADYLGDIQRDGKDYTNYSSPN